MPQYSEEFKEQVVRKMMTPNAMSVAVVVGHCVQVPGLLMRRLAPRGYQEIRT